MMSAIPAGADAAPQGAPTSSTTISIRLSVAPRVQLLMAAKAQSSSSAAGGAGFCLATNGPVSLLPVYFLLPAAGGSTAASPATGPDRLALAPCAGPSGIKDWVGAAGRPAMAGLALISPE